jgi:transposase-like protein
MDADSFDGLFPLDGDCVAFLERVRWNGKPICPYCKRSYTTPLRAEMRHHCNPCNVAFSVTVGTIFHHTRMPLQKWFLAIHLIAYAPQKLSVRELARDLGVNKNTASRVALRIKDAWREPKQRTLLNEIIGLRSAVEKGNES